MARKKNQPSTIDRLPEEIRERIAALRSAGRTIDEILDALNKLLPTEEVPSRPALGRHLKDWEKVSARIRESRAMAQALSRDFGDKPTSTVARANMELLHSAVLRLLTVAEKEGSASAYDTKDLMFIATALEKTAKASKLDFDQQLAAAKEKERRETLARAADVAASSAKEAGLSGETIDAIRKNILGIE